MARRTQLEGRAGSINEVQGELLAMAMARRRSREREHTEWSYGEHTELML